MAYTQYLTVNSSFLQQDVIKSRDPITLQVRYFLFYFTDVVFYAEFPKTDIKQVKTNAQRADFGQFIKGLESLPYGQTCVGLLGQQEARHSYLINLVLLKSSMVHLIWFTFKSDNCSFPQILVVMNHEPIKFIINSIQDGH